MTPSSWIRSFAWDALWLQSALWLAPLALLLARGQEDPSQGPLDLMVFGFTALFWIAHRFSSSWLAYATAAYRPLLRADPVRFAVVPVAIVATCFGVLLPGDNVLPYTRAERVVALATIDFALVTYHFAAQHYGVLSLYRARCGRAADARSRRLDRLFALGVGGALVLVIEAVAETTAFQELWPGPWRDRAWSEGAAELMRVGASALVAALTAAVLAVEARAAQPSVPRVLYVLGVALMVGIGLQADLPFLFVAVWSTQHWLVATALATRVACAEAAPPRASRIARALHAVNRRPWALLLALGSLSVLLLPVMEVEAVKVDGVYYGDRIFGAFGAALRASEWVPALLAFGFASGFLHYWLDRAVYRMSDPSVRAAARGLFAGGAPAALRPATTGSLRGPVPARRLFHRLSP